MIAMVDENRVEGGLRGVAGRVEEVAGAVSGNTSREASGKARQAAGNAQAAYGAALDEVRDFTLGQPLMALAMAAGAGLMLGALLSRR